MVHSLPSIGVPEGSELFSYCSYQAKKRVTWVGDACPLDPSFDVVPSRAIVHATVIDLGYLTRPADGVAPPMSPHP